MRLIHKVFDYIREMNIELEDKEKETEMDINRLDQLEKSNRILVEGKLFFINS